LNPGGVKSKNEKVALVASQVSALLGLEQSWLAQCQFKVTGWGIMFICGTVLRCTDAFKPVLSLNQLQQI